MLQLPRVKVIVHLVWRLYHQDTSTNLVLCRLSIRANINTMLQKCCQLCLCRFTSRGYGATAARLTPDQKVGSSNLSGLSAAARVVLSLVRPAPLRRADQSGESRCAGILLPGARPVCGEWSPVFGDQRQSSWASQPGGPLRAGPALPGALRICGARVGRRVRAQA